MLQGEVGPALGRHELAPPGPVLCICYKYYCSLDIPLADGMLETIVFSADQTDGPWRVTVGVSRVVISINYTNSCSVKMFI